MAARASRRSRSNPRIVVLVTRLRFSLTPANGLTEPAKNSSTLLSGLRPHFHCPGGASSTSRPINDKHAIDSCLPGGRGRHMADADGKMTGGGVSRSSRAGRCHQPSADPCSVSGFDPILSWGLARRPRPRGFRSRLSRLLGQSPMARDQDARGFPNMCQRMESGHGGRPGGGARVTQDISRRGQAIDARRSRVPKSPISARSRRVSSSAKAERRSRSSAAQTGAREPATFATSRPGGVPVAAAFRPRTRSPTMVRFMGSLGWANPIPAANPQADIIVAVGARLGEATPTAIS